MDACCKRCICQSLVNVPSDDELASLLGNRRVRGLYPQGLLDAPFGEQSINLDIRILAGQQRLL